MGIFSKKRHGEMIPVDKEGRRFTWRIDKFSHFKPGSTLDSDNVVCFTKAKFHFHMTLGVNDELGLYLHYKSTGIPKYSYYFSNSREYVMRQHTAHTIPPDTERCGHWNACYRPDMLEFLGEDDTLFVNFCFDDDSLSLRRLPQDNTVVVNWTIPRLFSQMLNPFSSKGFVNERSLMVVRLEIKKEAGASDVAAPYTTDNIKEVVFFVFCRKGQIPPHSIELLDGNARTLAKLEKKEEGGSQTLTVAKSQLMEALGMEGPLQVRVELQSGGNPLDALNALSGVQQQITADGGEGDALEPPQTVRIGEKKEEYIVMNGDD